MATPLVIQITKTSKNKEKAYIGGFLYTLNKCSSQLSHWVCEKRGTCKARLTTNLRIVVKPCQIADINSSHSHGPDTTRFEIVQSISQMKDRATNSEDSTRSILASGVGTMSNSSIAALPRFDSVKRTIRRVKSSTTDNVSNTTLLEEIIIPEKYKYTLKGQPFLLFDSGIGDINRLMIFGSPNMLSLLRDASNWFADGTFKVVPSQFYQMYTIHCEKDGYTIPCIYALMKDKRESTYDKLFKQLIQLEPGLNPSHIMVDFEKATHNALEENFIAVISGCFFHLAQNVFRQIQSNGLTARYLEDEEFSIQMKMLPSLAFVPEHDVIDSFTLLMAGFPESAKCIAEYFEINYIGRKLPDQSRRVPPFPIRLWNMYERATSRSARTNNSVEGWHNAFSSGINCSHPNIGRLLSYFQREQSLQEAILVKWETGEIPKMSKLSKCRNERIMSLVADYEYRDIFTYLKGIAYNFQF